ncbi:uncharacterized protein LOC114530648 [Dendronephthya gigantea]|uniref:uncharacterized protein LOC114530648 n=1 Tax=Dendronephthya gigantea TaxID=151771 RepID=UPI00106AE4E9|nr:uncharacterized protein LOC114530648 [Dendronephthya gigantea]
MAFGKTFRTQSRQLAFILLLLFGGFVVLLGLVVLAIGLTITHNDTFHETTDLKKEVEPKIDYVQYWVGFPYIIAGLSVLCSSINLQSISLTATSILLSLVCVVLSLAGLMVDGPDFNDWKSYRAMQRYWEGQDGYACFSEGYTCVCNGTGNAQKVITGFTDCETLMKLTSLYGVLIGCFIIGLVLLLISVFMIVYNVTSKREKARRRGDEYFTTMNDVVEETRQEPVFDNPVTNHTGYEYQMGPPAVEAPSKPAPYREYKQSTTADSTSHMNNLDDTSTIAENDGVVIMDPGRFRLGDDDIY